MNAGKITMKNKNLICLALIVFLIKGVSWGFWISQRGMKLRLVDKETKEPIKGALLINCYLCSTLAFDSASNRYETKTFNSDENGEITIPGYFRVTWPWEGFYEQGFSIFTIGYESIRGSISVSNRPSYVPLNWYDEAGLQNGNQIYISNKNPKNLRIIDEKNKISVEESSGGYMTIVSMKEPLKYLEIQMVPIKDEKAYLDNLGEMGISPFGLGLNPNEEKDEEMKQIIIKTHKFYIKNCDEFLKRYPNSVHRNDIISDIEHVYKEFLLDNENAEKYYNMLDEDGKHWVIIK